MCQLYPETFLCVTSSKGGSQPGPRPCPEPRRRRGWAFCGVQLSPEARAHLPSGGPPPLGSARRHPAGLPGGQGGQSGGRGGRPLHRQQPGRPAGALPPGHAVPDPHAQLQHALVSGPREAAPRGRGGGPRALPLCAPATWAGRGGHAALLPPRADNWLVDTGEDKAQSQGLSSFGQVSGGARTAVTIGRDMTQDTASHLAGLFISRKRRWQGWPRGGRPAGTHCSTVWSQLSSHYGFINTWP